MTQVQRAGVVLVSLALAVATCGVQTCRLRHAVQRAESAEAAEAMTAAGWTAAEERRRLQVPVPLPAGVKPAAVVEGSVGYGRPRSLPPGPGGSIPPTTMRNPGSGGEAAVVYEGLECPGNNPSATWPTPEDLAGGCRTYLVEKDGAWWARSFWTGRLQLPDGGELVRPDVELELQRVEVRKAIVEPRERRLSTEVGVGVTDGLHARLWGAVAWRRVGAWAAVDSDGRRAGGALWRF